MKGQWKKADISKSWRLSGVSVISRRTWEGEVELHNSFLSHGGERKHCRPGNDHVQTQCSNKSAGSEKESWMESEVKLKIEGKHCK